MPVGAPLDLGEQREDREGPLAHRGAEVGLLDPGPQVGPVSLGRGAVVLDVQVHGRHPRADHPGDVERDLVGQHGRDRAAHGLQVRARVEQGTQEHVAGDAGGGVDPQVPVHTT